MKKNRMILILAVLVGSIGIFSAAQLKLKEENLSESSGEGSVCERKDKKTMEESSTEEENDEEETIEGKNGSFAWLLPDESDSCFLTNEEELSLQKYVLSAAEQIKEVYKEIKIAEGPSYASNIENFTINQCHKAVSLLGQAGYTSIADDYDMENPEAVEEFYTAYLENKDARVTVFEVNNDGFLSAVTFLHRDSKLQVYYLGIGWREGGVPEIRDVSVNDIAEIKLTKKGYFIYAYEKQMAHAGVRQYWRLAPLSNECRDLTKKYVTGLSYVNYNILTTNWNSDNVEEILMPCMFEDIYRIYTGENINAAQDYISAEFYEKIMMTCLPVSAEQLRKNCGYDAVSNSYRYEMIYAKPYAPYGEVVDYTENADGTITLIVDCVWIDNNSDCAYTNQIVVLPFADGTFRYLSNSIEEKELKLP